MATSQHNPLGPQLFNSTKAVHAASKFGHLLTGFTLGCHVGMLGVLFDNIEIIGLFPPFGNSELVISSFYYRSTTIPFRLIFLSFFMQGRHFYPFCTLFTAISLKQTK